MSNSLRNRFTASLQNEAASAWKHSPHRIVYAVIKLIVAALVAYVVMEEPHPLITALICAFAVVSIAVCIKDELKHEALYQSPTTTQKQESTT